MQLVAELITDRLNDAFWRVTTKDASGISVTKVLSHETFVNTLKSNTIIRREKKHAQIGKLPYGYVDMKFGGDGDYKVAVYYPPKKRGLLYYKDLYYVPYPGTLYVLNVQKGRLYGKDAFAVLDNDISYRTKLYNYPFGNVGTAGGMCFGGIKIPSLNKVGSIDELLALFLDGSVNDDLYSPSKNNSKGLKQYELLKLLETKQKFPKDLLVETNLTFGKIFNY